VLGGGKGGWWVVGGEVAGGRRRGGRPRGRRQRRLGGRPRDRRMMRSFHISHVAGPRGPRPRPGSGGKLRALRDVIHDHDSTRVLSPLRKNF
jgi:hypothetical protein